MWVEGNGSASQWLACEPQAPPAPRAYIRRTPVLLVTAGNCVARSKKPPLHAIPHLSAFFRRQPRTGADNYAKFLVATRPAQTYPLMPESPLLTGSSLGKLGSAVKKAPVLVVTRHAKRQPEWHFTTS